MTILTAAQSAIARLIGQRPAAVVSSTDEICVEITALAQEAAVDILKAHDWRALMKLQTVTGDGTPGHAMPADYDRMALGQSVYSTAYPDWDFAPVQTLDDWDYLQRRDFSLSPGSWIILDGTFQTLPMLAAGEEARFYYVSRNIFIGANGTPKATIESDTDAFRLDERLLTLSLIWRWKQLKQMDYAEEMRLYEDALSQEMARDGGSVPIRRNGSVRFKGAVNAWPWTLG